MKESGGRFAPAGFLCRKGVLLKTGQAGKRRIKNKEAERSPEFSGLRSAVFCVSAVVSIVCGLKNSWFF